MTLEEEWEACVKRFNRLAALIVRKKNGEPCGKDHEWRRISMDCGEETLQCLVCRAESVTDYES